MSNKIGRTVKGDYTGFGYADGASAGIISGRERGGLGGLVEWESQGKEIYAPVLAFIALESLGSLP